MNTYHYTNVYEVPTEGEDMDPLTVIGYAASLIALYGVYRLVTFSSDAYLDEHDAAHAKLVAIIEECDSRSKSFVRSINTFGYVMTKEGHGSPQQDKNRFIEQLRLADQAISAQLHSDRANVLRFRWSAWRQVVQHNKMLQESQLRLRTQMFLVRSQYQTLYSIR